MAKKPTQKARTFTLSLSPRYRKDLKLLAIKQGTSATGLVRKWIDREKQIERQKEDEE